MNPQLICALCVSFLLLWQAETVSSLDAGENPSALRVEDGVTNGQKCSSTKTCQDGYHCCGSSTCCLNAYQCCGGNTYCCTKRLLKMIAKPAISEEEILL